MGSEQTKLEEVTRSVDIIRNRKKQNHNVITIRCSKCGGELSVENLHKQLIATPPEEEE